ncbi:hypothetical protein Fmac_019279 [Flemingia macrophylla]|uniref:Pectinesterase inhibitor domain-containing protein n=1 Tax=Flemingia macrophylla TaxID=520843 RepID=A0ABD1M825_9FABA
MPEGIVEKGKRIAIIVVSILLLVAMIVAMTFGFNRDETDSNNDIEDTKKNNVVSNVKFVQILCHPTNHKKECEESLIVGAGNTTNPEELIKIALNITMAKIGDKLKETNLLHEIEEDPRTKMAFDTCKQLMDRSIGELTRSLDGINELDQTNIDKIVASLKVWLNGAITYQDTCLHGFENTTSEAGKNMKDLVTTCMHMSNSALAIITEFAGTFKDSNVTKLLGRRLMQHSDIPSRVNHRRLLPNTYVTS